MMSLMHLAVERVPGVMTNVASRIAPRTAPRIAPGVFAASLAFGRSASGRASGRRRFAIIASLLLLAGCGGSDRSGDGTSAATDSAQSIAPDAPGSRQSQISFTAAQIEHGGVRWEPAVTSEVLATVEVPGQLVPNEHRTARLGAPAEGRVMVLHVHPGDVVAKGEALMTLESVAASAAASDLQKATAELTSRRAAANFARSAKDRADRLLAIKAGSRLEAERAAADDELAQAAVAQSETELARARSTLTQMGASTVDGTMMIRSPMSGVVLSHDASPGQVVQTGASLVTVSDPTSLWLEIAASNSVAASLNKNSRVRFAISSIPRDTFDARVESISGALDSVSRTVTVYALVNNRSRQLRPAMFATAWVQSGRRNVVMVPDSAVQLLDNRAVLFIVKQSGSGPTLFERRDVELGASAGGQTQVISGVASGELVVIGGAFSLKSEFARSKMAEG